MTQRSPQTADIAEDADGYTVIGAASPVGPVEKVGGEGTQQQGDQTVHDTSSGHLYYN